MALSAGAKKILMAAAAKKAACKTPVKVARPFMAPVLAAQAPAVKKALDKAVKAAVSRQVEAPKLPAIKPCRFCKLKCVRLETGVPSLGYWVRCDNKDCLSHGPRKSSHLEAVTAWNS